MQSGNGLYVANTFADLLHNYRNSFHLLFDGFHTQEQSKTCPLRLYGLGWDLYDSWDHLQHIQCTQI